MIWSVVLIGLVPAVVSEIGANSISLTAWACLAGSGVSCGVYFYALARAYGTSDFTIVYPVARALPVVLIGLGDVLRGNPLTPAGWGGIALVVIGCTLCPLHSFVEFSWRRYVNRSIAWMLLTALGTVGYTMFDKVASEAVAQGAGTAARYCYFFFVTTLFVYLPMTALLGRRKDRAPYEGWRTPLLAAVFNFGAYWLVLWAYQMTPRAGYIVAFRQFSIVIGVVLAFLLYKEKGRGVRLTGSALITAGLVVIGLWGG
jgi:drug/metabolite transporter (DMT)-like permease